MYRTLFLVFVIFFKLVLEDLLNLKKMSVGIHQFARLLATTLNTLFPKLRCAVYASRRRQYIHLGLDFEFFTFPDVIKLWKQLKILMFMVLTLTKLINVSFQQECYLQGGKEII